MIRDLFVKKIDRKIDGVIKTDSKDSLESEFEEYVITNEVNTKLTTLFENYTSQDNVTNGIWISGFFGSGKSHLLKILSYLLENAQIGEHHALDYFEKNADAMLFGQMQKAVQIPSKSILFNICALANGRYDSRTAVTMTFKQAFDDSCGYYGKLPHVAGFERALDEMGKYDEFKRLFKQHSGKEWEEARRTLIAHKDVLSKVFAIVTDQSEDTLLFDHLKRDFGEVSVENFVSDVKHYIEKQGALFRLNFFVDEVGQYIADDVQKMSTIQTIAEKLSSMFSKQKRSWVCLTGQANLDDVLRDNEQKLGNDFSRIQGRFKLQIVLSEKNINEVIQRRLLDKNMEGMQILHKLHEENHKSYRTLFDFKDGPKNFSSYRDEDEFSASYPFVTYQFPLFVRSLNTLSEHNAFPGKFVSTGARSMLDVFHVVLEKVGNLPVSELITYDLLFDGLKDMFKPNVYSSISLAESSLFGEDSDEVKVLKTLFLIKYLKNDFNPTAHNISVLLYPKFGTNPEDVKKKVINALGHLESQTCIQRNGDQYDYLTDEEKDVKEEIKNVQLASSAEIEAIHDLIFNQMIKNKIIVNGASYSFSKYVEGVKLGKDYELGINIAFESNDDFNSPVSLNANKDILLVLVKDTGHLIIDIREYLRTKKYCSQSTTSLLTPDREDVIKTQNRRNEERLKLIKIELEKVLNCASFYVGSTLVSNTRGVSFNQALLIGFEQLVNTVYINLGMLTQVFNDEDLTKALNPDNLLLKPDEAMQDILTSIRVGKGLGVIVTVKSLLEKYQKKPYGWANPSILFCILVLASNGKIQVKIDTKPVTGLSLVSLIKNTGKQDSLVINELEDIPSHKINAVRDFIEKLTDNIRTNTTEPQALKGELINALNELKSKCNDLVFNHRYQYGFVLQLNNITNLIDSCLSNDNYLWFFDFFLYNQGSQILDYKETLVSPIIRFFNTKKLKDEYDNALNFMKENEICLREINFDKANAIDSLMKAKDIFSRSQLSLLTLSIVEGEKIVSDYVKKMKDEANLLLSDWYDNLKMSTSWTNASEEIKCSISTRVNNLFSGLLFKSVTDSQAAKFRLVELKDEVYNLLNPKSSVLNDEQDVFVRDPIPHKDKSLEVILQSIKPNSRIKTKEDVDKYVASLRAKMLFEIDNGNEIV